MPALLRSLIDEDFSGISNPETELEHSGEIVSLSWIENAPSEELELLRLQHLRLGPGLAAQNGLKFEFVLGPHGVYDALIVV